MDMTEFNKQIQKLRSDRDQLGKDIEEFNTFKKIDDEKRKNALKEFNARQERINLDLIQRKIDFETKEK